MAVRAYKIGSTDSQPVGGIGFYTLYVADTFAERPTGGLNAGDVLLSLDLIVTGLVALYYATSSSTWGGANFPAGIRSTALDLMNGTRKHTISSAAAGGDHIAVVPNLDGDFALWASGYSPAVGDMLYANSVVLGLAALAIGTSGKFLRTNGSAPSWQAILETDITDGTLLARLAANETIAGNWTFNGQLYAFNATNLILKASTVYFYSNSGINPLSLGSEGITSGRILSSLDITASAVGVGASSDPPGSLLMGKVDRTGQTGDITSVKLTDTTPAGMYRVDYVLSNTTLDITAGVLTLTLSWTDRVGATTATSTLSLSTGLRSQGSVVIYLASGNITWATTHTGIFGTSVYAVDLRCEFLG